jgi:hypothetical protein
MKFDLSKLSLQQLQQFIDELDVLVDELHQSLPELRDRISQNKKVAEELEQKGLISLQGYRKFCEENNLMGDFNINFDFLKLSVDADFTPTKDGERQSRLNDEPLPEKECLKKLDLQKSAKEVDKSVQDEVNQKGKSPDSVPLESPPVSIHSSNGVAAESTASGRTADCQKEPSNNPPTPAAHTKSPDAKIPEKAPSEPKPAEPKPPAPASPDTARFNPFSKTFWFYEHREEGFYPSPNTFFPPYMLHPYSNGILIWNSLYNIIMIYVLAVVPFSFSTFTQSYRNLSMISIVAVVIDVLLILNTADFSEDIPNVDRRFVWKKYRQSNRIYLDLITGFPWALIHEYFLFLHAFSILKVFDSRRCFKYLSIRRLGVAMEINTILIAAFKAMMIQLLFW